jgi:hypothetical protein
MMRLAALAFVCASTAHATVPQCDLGLSLGFDVSASITGEAHRLTREGTVFALTHPEVVAAMSRGGVYVQVFEWAEKQQLLADWTKVGGPEDLTRLAETIRSAPRPRLGTSTFTGNAMAFARVQFDRLPCARHVLDLLADGENNGGALPEVAREAFDIDRHQVNVLLVGTRATGLVDAEERVKFGLGAFVLPVADFKGVALGMYRKLLREVSMSLWSVG